MRKKRRYSRYQSKKRRSSRRKRRTRTQTIQRYGNTRGGIRL
jgi:hypothetical protein